MSTSTSFKKYLAEGLLIVFSVLFALFINQLVANYQLQQRKQTAMASIKKELEKNAAIIDRWQAKHQAVKDRLTAMIEGQNDSLLQELSQYDFFNLSVLTNNESLLDDFVTNTAWETAKTTGILAEFDFATTEKLTHVYTLQQVITDKTVIKVLDFYFDTDERDMKNLKSTLTQFQLRIWELVGQERLLADFYREAIAELDCKG